MEWNVKWDWENLVAFGSKAIENENENENENEKVQLADNWAMVDDGSFNLPANTASSAKTTSLSASTGSSCKDGTSEEEGSFKLSGTPSSAEALLGLKLGKRTYFENSAAAAEIGPKKTKSSSRINSPIFCQVEGCNVDLSLAKEYHRKHRVCDSHSKCPKVVVGGRERRFCQQCSRFHSLSEFDEKKRSCRRRLSDHNARRRKPQQETIQFSSPRLSTPFHGGAQQMSFVLDNSPLVYSRIPVNSNSKFTLAKGYSFKSDGNGNGNGGCDEQLHLPATRVPQAINMQNAADGRLSASKNTLNPGSKGSSACSLGAAPEYRRALSLLSSNSCNQESIQLHDNSPNIIPPTYQSIPQGVPFSSSELWPTGPHPVNHHHLQSLPSFNTPSDGDFCSNLLN